MAVIHSLFRETGTVRINDETCKRCGQCVQICPGGVLKMSDQGVQVDLNSPFGCIACGHCMMVCQDGSITVTGRGISPLDLEPMPKAEQKATADSLQALMRSRRSVRLFKDREVDAGTLERILEMTASGPMGIPPWDVGCVIVNGREKIREIAGEVIKDYEGFLKLFKPWLLTLMRPFVGRIKYEQFRYFLLPLAHTYVDYHHDGSDKLFYDAPALLIFHHSPYTDVVDTTIALTYAMLAAESLGLGSTIIGGAPPILQRNQRLCRELGIPEGHKPVSALILGYPASHFKKTVKRRLVAVNRVS